MTNKERSKAYYQKNKHKWIKYRALILTESDRTDYNEKRRRRWNFLHFEYKLFKAAQSRSKEKGILFTITLNDIIIPEYCILLGIKLTRVVGKGRVGSNPSIDRIDPEKGYVKENIQIISIKANIMKSNASKEELLIFAHNVLRIYE
jgi:hypothetical protein